MKQERNPGVRGSDFVKPRCVAKVRMERFGQALFHFRILALAFLYGEDVFNCIIRPSTHLSYHGSS